MLDFAVCIFLYDIWFCSKNILGMTTPLTPCHSPSWARRALVLDKRSCTSVLTTWPLRWWCSWRMLKLFDRYPLGFFPKRRLLIPEGRVPESGLRPRQANPSQIFAWLFCCHIQVVKPLLTAIYWWTDKWIHLYFGPVWDYNFHSDCLRKPVTEITCWNLSCRCKMYHHPQPPPPLPSLAIPPLSPPQPPPSLAQHLYHYHLQSQSLALNPSRWIPRDPARTSGSLNIDLIFRKKQFLVSDVRISCPLYEVPVAFLTFQGDLLF